VRLAGDDLDRDHRRDLVRYEEELGRLGLSYQLLYPDAPVPPGVEVVFDAAKPFVSPAFRSAGGTLPDELKSTIPLRVAPGYSMSYAVSRDRSTLLAYLWNNGGHFELASPLAGRFHRQPKAAALELAFQELAARPLRLRLYDLNRKKLVRDTSWKAATTHSIRETRADYFLLVTP
jgi:hypothetical protein